MTQKIHPTAYISEQAELADDVNIGAFAVIEAHTKIGAGCVIGPHAVVHAYTHLGVGNVLHAHAVLGGLPQDINFAQDTVTWLQVGEHNVFREGFTAHRASKPEQSTRIGNHCYFMSNSHVAHDCEVGNKTIFANNVAIGGHVQIGDHVFMGGGSVVHQFCRVGSFAMVRGLAGLSMDAMPFMIIGGAPGRHYKLNTVGLRRNGITGERYKILSSAVRLLKSRQSLEALPETEELTVLKAWLAVKSKRGVHGFVDSSAKREQE